VTRVVIVGGGFAGLNADLRRRTERAAGDGQQENVVNVRLWDKPKTLALLFKRLGENHEYRQTRESGRRSREV